MPRSESSVFDAVERGIRASHEGRTQPVLVSARSARSLWEGCSPEYIRTVCHGRCCRVQGADGRFTTTIPLQHDQARLLAVLRGSAGGVLEGDPRTPSEVARGVFPCRHQTSCGMCSLHGKNAGPSVARPMPLKPRSCTLSPWRVTSARERTGLVSGYTRYTLSIRNRYRLLSCFKHERAVPAYRAFRDGLVLLFGEEQTDFAASLFADSSLEDPRVSLYARPEDVEFFRAVSSSRAAQAQKRPLVGSGS